MVALHVKTVLIVSVAVASVVAIFCATSASSSSPSPTVTQVAATSGPIQERSSLGGETLSSSARAAVGKSIPSNIFEHNQKFLLLESPPPHWMGLTNQMILFSEVMFVALLSERDAVVLPAAAASSSSSSSSPSFSFLDFEATAKKIANLHPSRRRIEILTFEEFQRQQYFVENIVDTGRLAQYILSDKKTKLKLPGRALILRDRVKARQVLDANIKKISSLPVVRLGRSSILWHVAFSSLPSRAENPAELFDAVSFSSQVHRMADEFLGKHHLISGADDRNNNNITIVFHLRMEPDIVGFSPSEFAPPAKEKLQKFLSFCLLPKVKKRISKIVAAVAGRKSKGVTPTSTQIKVLLLGGSSLDEELRKVAVDTFLSLKQQDNEGGKSIVSVEVLSTSKGRRFDADITKALPLKKAATTNHTEAAVDALVAVKANPMIVIGADFSTFTRAIQIRKCLELERSLSPFAANFDSLFLYDHRLSRVKEVAVDGKVENCRSRSAADAEGDEQNVLDNPFATVPHAYVPGYRKKKEDEC